MSTDLALRATVRELVAAFESAERDVRESFARIVAAEERVNVDIVEAAIRKGFFADLRRRLREEFAQILSVVPADAQPRDPEQT